MSSELNRTGFRRRSVAAACGLSVALSLGSTVYADQAAFSRPDPFSSLVGERERQNDEVQRATMVQRFITAEDERVFLVERDGSVARLKFLCGANDPRVDCRIDTDLPAEEIFTMTAIRGPRGDTVFRDAAGETRLRLSAYGGATVFWPGSMRGNAALQTFAEDPALSLFPAELETAELRARRATAITSARTGEPIVFSIGEPASDPDVGVAVLADAIARTASGISIVARDPTGARILASRIDTVRFEAAAAPSLALSEKTLVVGYNPALDIEGRPGSEEVAQFLEENL